MLLVFLKDVCNAHQGRIYFIKNTVKIEILLQLNVAVFYLNKYLKCELFLWCDAKFSASVFNLSVSHDPSEIILICWFAAKKTVQIIISVENTFCEEHDV